jgi:adenylosuccinate lyase
MREAISPLDGRYAAKLEQNSQFFSEKALMYNRCKVELLYVLALDKTGLFTPLTTVEKNSIQDCMDNFTTADYQRIKEIERVTNHDLKACELFLRERVPLGNVHLWHFGLTSEDANNLAYTFMLQGYLATIQLPQLEKLLQKLIVLAQEWKTIAFPTRTHGQKASPSTAGKELAVFLNRLTKIYTQLRAFRFSGKLNGAVGNYSALLAAFPTYDWLSFSHDFLESCDLVPNIATTQIEDHDAWATYFNWTRQINNIVLDLNIDCWLYISQGLFRERVKEGEVGSSTMPHKVNPINFENSEGNLSLSNSLLNFMSDKLCRSRMQRDLSDSTVKRNIGVAVSHAYLGLMETLRGLNKLQINVELCQQTLHNSPELLTEPIQTILKTVGVEDPYTLLKKVARGHTPTRATLMELVDGLDIPSETKEQIHALTAVTYVGDAARICDLVVAMAQKAIKK